jgi:hypothetical protein
MDKTRKTNSICFGKPNRNIPLWTTWMEVIDVREVGG